MSTNSTLLPEGKIDIESLIKHRPFIDPVIDIAEEYISKANKVYAYVHLNRTGQYLEIKKHSLRRGVKNEPRAYRVGGWWFRDGDLYIN